MAKRDVLMNGLTLKNISIVIGIIVAAGSLVWAFAIQSEGFNKDLDHVIEDVKETDAEVSAMDMQLGAIQKAVNIMQIDLKYIKEDIAEQKELSKEILKELRK